MAPWFQRLRAVLDVLEVLEAGNHISLTILQLLDVADPPVSVRCEDLSDAVGQVHRGWKLARQFAQHVIEREVAVRGDVDLLACLRIKNE